MHFHRIHFGIAFALGLLACVSTASFAAQKHPHFPITGHQAKVIVLKQFPRGKIVGKMTLENEEGTWQYGVMVKDGKTLHEVMVNAQTGHIDNDEVTNAAKERTEAKADAASATQSQHATDVKAEKGE